MIGRSRLVETGIVVLATLFGLVLAAAGVRAYQANSRGLRTLVDEALADTRLENPVTAVLLDFRGYDTLLEVGVLLLAWITATTLGPASPTGAEPAHLRRIGTAVASTERSLARLLLPPLLLVAAYLLWRGADAPGGALQAGAVAAAALVVWRVGTETFASPWLVHGRWLAPGALAAFLLAGVSVGMTTGAFLDYPRAVAREVMMGIEVITTGSVACILAALFERVLSGGDNAR